MNITTFSTENFTVKIKYFLATQGFLLILFQYREIWVLLTNIFYDMLYSDAGYMLLRSGLLDSKIFVDADLKHCDRAFMKHRIISRKSLRQNIVISHEVILFNFKTHPDNGTIF